MALPQVPDYIISSVFELTPERLKKKGIRLVLADLDNTLARYREKTASPELMGWKRELEQAGILVFIVSNSRKPTRAKNFARSFGAGFIGHAGKPSPKGFYRALEETGCKKEEALMVGDQIFTDIWGAHNAGVLAVLTEPVVLDNAFRRLRYMIETPFRAHCLHKEGLE